MPPGCIPQLVNDILFTLFQHFITLFLKNVNSLSLIIKHYNTLLSLLSILRKE